MINEKFWLVWDREKTMPRVMHKSLESATREAERLARLNPGHVLDVLESIEARVINQMQVITYEPPVPF